MTAEHVVDVLLEGPGWKGVVGGALLGAGLAGAYYQGAGTMDRVRSAVQQTAHPSRTLYDQQVLKNAQSYVSVMQTQSLSAGRTQQINHIKDMIRQGDAKGIVDTIGENPASDANIGADLMKSFQR